MGDHPGAVGHPNGVESSQKSIGTIRCNLAILLQQLATFLDIFGHTNETNKTNACTKPYIEAACCIKRMSFIVAINVVAGRPPERQPTGTPHARANIFQTLLYFYPFKYYVIRCGGREGSRKGPNCITQ